MIGEERDVCAGCTAEIVREPDGRWVDADTGEGRCIWTTNRHDPAGALVDDPEDSLAERIAAASGGLIEYLGPVGSIEELIAKAPPVPVPVGETLLPWRDA